MHACRFITTVIRFPSRSVAGKPVRNYTSRSSAHKLCAHNLRFACLVSLSLLKYVNSKTLRSYRAVLFRMPMGSPTSGQHVRHEDSPKPSFHVAPMSGYGSDPNGEDLHQSALSCIVPDCAINPTAVSSDMHVLLTQFSSCESAVTWLPVPCSLINVCRDA